MNFKQNKLIAGAIATVIALAFHLLIFLIAMVLPEGGLAQRVAEVMGASFPGGIIQFATTVIFTYAMLMSYSESQLMAIEQSASELNLLPEREQLVLDADDVAKIKLEAIELDRQQPTLLFDMVKKACTQFRANKSVGEMMEVVQTQSRINRQLSASDVDALYHANSVIPSIGFIGTIIGIASALGLAYLVVPDAPMSTDMLGALDAAGTQMGQAQQGIAAVTQQLYVAFDTTLWALLLNLVLSFRLSGLSTAMEKLHGHLESYVLENLVNRVYQN